MKIAQEHLHHFMLAVGWFFAVHWHRLSESGPQTSSEKSDSLFAYLPIPGICQILDVMHSTESLSLFIHFRPPSQRRATQPLIVGEIDSDHRQQQFLLRSDIEVLGFQCADAGH